MNGQIWLYKNAGLLHIIFDRENISTWINAISSYYAAGYGVIRKYQIQTCVDGGGSMIYRGYTNWENARVAI